jgi:hypothetical protein
MRDMGRSRKIFNSTDISRAIFRTSLMGVRHTFGAQLRGMGGVWARHFGIQWPGPRF